MKKKYLALLLLFQMILFSKTSGQAVGIGTSTVSGFPLSTLDIGGNLGFTISTSLVNTTQPSVNSVVLYSTYNGTATTSMPAASTTYLRRIYIVSYAGGNKTSMSLSPLTYYDLTHTLISSIPNNTSIMIICDGQNWLQIL